MPLGSCSVSGPGHRLRCDFRITVFTTRRLIFPGAKRIGRETTWSWHLNRGVSKDRGIPTLTGTCRAWENRQFYCNVASAKSEMNIFLVSVPDYHYCPFNLLQCHREYDTFPLTFRGTAAPVCISGLGIFKGRKHTRVLWTNKMSRGSNMVCCHRS